MRFLIAPAGMAAAAMLAYPVHAEPITFSSDTFQIIGGISSEATTPVRRSNYRGKEIVDFQTQLAPGTILIRTKERKLYYILPEGRAISYGIGVGREGFTWSGTDKVSRKAEWPDWVPPKEMIEREADRGNYLPVRMLGGPDNPLGARALYIGTTLYRIHGTNQPWSIGQSVSSGCIRLMNEEVIDLYNRVDVGATVVVE
ncbi:L,D-transpeptidase [Nordella sp. HKS 07]|uniref:L,D-transpeptidase n=1 Tax=Nordella sp. HKS 07 TaxID=2712222 RepID=UPI001FEDFF5A|nr:L,D-transpeptidase [Nordella sp. HKS 07]